MSTFMQIDCNEVRNEINEKIKSIGPKQEGDIKYYNFVVLNLIEKINPKSYADFGFSKILASYFDIPINTGVSKVTYEDFQKVNTTLSEIEKYLNDEVKTNGTLYLARNENNFSIMYYEVL